MNTSKQLMIVTHFGQYNLKSIGRVFLNTSLSGQKIRNFSLGYKTSKTLANIRETVEG